MFAENAWPAIGIKYGLKIIVSGLNHARSFAPRG